MASLTFSGLQTEVFARGFEFLNDSGTGLTRVKRWINQAYHEINNADDWPYLETSTSGSAPVTVADLRKVLTVHDATNFQPLRPTTRGWIIATFGNVTSTTGYPRFYYVENTVVRAYPVSGTVLVYYLKVPADLSAAGDTHIVPTRYEELIVEGAVRRALQDEGAYDQAQAIEASRLAGLEAMRQALLTQKPMPEIDDQAQAPTREALSQQAPR